MYCHDSDLPGRDIKWPPKKIAIYYLQWENFPAGYYKIFSAAIFLHFVQQGYYRGNIDNYLKMDH
jgi:hypothetical protein